MFRQEQIDILIKKFPAQYKQIMATTSYKEGRARLVAWSRSAHARYVHMHSNDTELMAIEALEEEWIKQYPGMPKLSDARKKRDAKKVKEHEAWLEKNKDELEARDKAWAKEYIEHWLDNMWRWKHEGILKTLLDQERFHDERFEAVIANIKKYFGDEEANTYQKEHDEIVKGVEYVHETTPIEHNDPNLLRKARLIELLDKKCFDSALRELETIILFSPENFANECKEIYRQTVES